MAEHEILLDACVAINLMASGHWDAIASARCTTFLLVREAAAETGELRDVVAGEIVRTPIDFTPHVTQGTARVIELDAAELARYVECARQVGDGEAATIAAAVGRGLPLATDDRRARRLCARLKLPTPIRTLALLRRYAEAVELADSDVRHLLRIVRDRASFAAPRDDPDGEWWRSQLGAQG
jgi:predicted nucleic acid-binding protein